MYSNPAQDKVIPWKYFIGILILIPIAMLVLAVAVLPFILAAGMNAGTGQTPFSFGLILFLPFLPTITGLIIFWRVAKGVDIKWKLFLSIVLIVVPILLALFSGLFILRLI